MEMKNVREILLEYWWRTDKDFSEIQIYIIHRGAKGDIRVIKGSEVVKISREGIFLSNCQIPFHRVIKICYKDQTLYEKTSL